MSSPSSVLTGGYLFTPSLVITSGYGASAGVSKSNWLRTNPWNIQVTGPGVLWRGMIPMIQCAYVGYTSASHAVEVYNTLGKLVARLSGRTDLNSVRTGRISWVDGLVVPALLENGGTNLPSGRLLVYFR